MQIHQIYYLRTQTFIDFKDLTLQIHMCGYLRINPIFKKRSSKSQIPQTLNTHHQTPKTLTQQHRPSKNLESPHLEYKPQKLQEFGELIVCTLIPTYLRFKSRDIGLKEFRYCAHILQTSKSLTLKIETLKISAVLSLNTNPQISQI